MSDELICKKCCCVFNTGFICPNCGSKDICKLYSNEWKLWLKQFIGDMHEV